MGDLSPTRAETGVIHAMIPRAIKSQIADSGDAAPLDPKLVPTIRKHVVAMIAGDPHARQALENMLAEHHLTVGQPPLGHDRGTGSHRPNGGGSW
jgi:hypothetical protein